MSQKHDANGGLSLVGQWESRTVSNKTGREQRPVTNAAQRTNTKQYQYKFHDDIPIRT
jgi:predicted porin